MSNIMIGDVVVVTGVTGVGGSSFDIRNIGKRGVVSSIDPHGLCDVLLDGNVTDKFWRGTEIAKEKAKSGSVS